MRFQIRVIQVDEPSADSPPGQGSPPTNQARKVEEGPAYIGGGPGEAIRASLGTSDYPNDEV